MAEVGSSADREAKTGIKRLIKNYAKISEKFYKNFSIKMVVR